MVADIFAQLSHLIVKLPTALSKLNDGQLELFNFISKHAIEPELATKNGLDKPDPSWIFLSGGLGFGKSVLVKLITEQLKKILK